VVDFCDLPSSEINAEIRRIATALIMKPVDLSTEPLFEAKVVKFANTEHALIFVMDHLVADGISTQILSEELWTLYKQGYTEFRYPSRHSLYSSQTTRCGNRALPQHG